MICKKSWFGYILWACFATVACAYFISVVSSFLDCFGLNDLYVQMGIIGFFMVLALGVFALVRRRIQNRLANGSKVTAMVWEACIGLVVVAGGIAIRILLADRGGQELAYYETAMVTGEPLSPILYGIQYLYICTLRGLFLVFGNRFFAGIILQITLQVLAALIWYFAIRRINGPVTAGVYLAGIMLLPGSVEAGITYSPKMVFLFLYGILMLMISGRLCKKAQGVPLKWYSWLQILVIGAGIGALTYLDVTGLTLLVPAHFIYFVRSRSEEEKKSAFLKTAMQTAVILLSALAAFVLMFVVDGLQTGTNPASVFTIWCNLFSHNNGALFPPTVNPSDMLGAGTVSLVAFLLLIGIFSFFSDNETECQMISFTQLGCLLLLIFIGLPTTNVDCGYLMLNLILMLTGAGIQSLVYNGQDFFNTEEEEAFVLTKEEKREIKQRKKAEKAALAENKKKIDKKELAEKKKHEKAEKKEQAERIKQRKAKKKTESKNTPAPAPAPAPVPAPAAAPAFTSNRTRYIENPLPLPKRHERKDMDYDHFVPTDRLRYDVAVASDDDFDI